MELYIGGRSQGKLAYVKKQHKADSLLVVEGPDAPNIAMAQSGKRIVWYGFHCWVRANLVRGMELEKELMQLVSVCPYLSIISDEVGNGIVPLSKEDREYRETVGRLLCILAEKADRMERIICGIGQKIK